jgi:hypothetical protein
MKETDHVNVKKMNFIDSMIVFLYAWYHIKRPNDGLPVLPKVLVLMLISLPIGFCIMVVERIYHIVIIPHIDNRFATFYGLIFLSIFWFFTIKTKDLALHEKDKEILGKGKEYCANFLWLNILLFAIRVVIL